MRLRSAVVASVLLGASGAACGRSEPAAPPAATADAPARGQPGAPSTQEPTTPAAGLAPGVVRAAQGLPAGTIVSLTLADPFAVFDRMQLQRVVAALPDEVRTQPKGALGADPYTADGWRALGLDPNGPAGFAVLRYHPFSGVGYLALGDKAKLDATLARLAGDDLQREAIAGQAGSGELLTWGMNITPLFVIGQRLYVLPEGFAADQRALAKQLADVTEATSLATTEGFRAATARLSGARHGALYVDMPTLVAQTTALGQEAEQEMPAPADGDEEDVWAKEMRARREADRALLERGWGSMTSLAVGLDVQDRGVAAQLFAPLKAGSLLDRATVNLTGTPAVVKAQATRPSALVAWGVEPKAALELFDLMLRTESTTVDEVRAELKEAGIDLDGLVGLLAGEVGGAVTLDYDKALAATEPGQSDLLQGGGALKVTDEAAARAYVDGLTATEAGRGVVTPNEGGGWTVRLGESVRLQATVAGGYLAFATDPAFVGRVGRGEATGWPADEAHPGLRALAQAESVALLYVMEQALGAGMFLTIASHDFEPPLPEAPTGEARAAFDAKAAELRAVQKELRELRQAEERKANERVIGLMRAVGATGVALRKDGGALVGDGGQYLGAESWGALMDRVAGLIREEASGAGRNERLFELYGQESRLLDELRGLSGGAQPVPPPVPVPAPDPGVAPE